MSNFRLLSLACATFVCGACHSVKAPTARPTSLEPPAIQAQIERIKAVQADVLAFVQAAVEAANQKAAEWDGQTFVDQEVIEKHVFFVPAPTEAVEAASLRDIRYSPPDNAVEQIWRDEWILVQHFEYRYSDAQIARITPLDQAPYFTAVAEVHLVTRQRWVSQKTEQVRPEPPEGTIRFRPKPLTGRGSLPWNQDPLPLPAHPKGAAYAQGMLLPPAARPLVAELEQKPMESKQAILALPLTYDPDHNTWTIEPLQPPQGVGQLKSIQNLL